MKKLLLLFGILVAVPCAIVMGQNEVNIKTILPPGLYDIVPKGTVPPVDSCKCKDGVTPNVSATAATGPIGVTESGTLENPVFNFSIPPGKDGKGIVSITSNPDTSWKVTYTDGTVWNSPPLQGPQGNCTGCPSGGGSQTKNVFDVTLGPFNVKGDGVNNDGPGLQAAINTAKVSNVSGVILIPPPTNFYRVNGPLFIHPDASNQVWMDIVMLGGKAGAMQYFGPTGTALFNILGLKQSRIEGVNADLAGGIAGRQIIDVRTTPTVNSSTGVTLNSCFFRLGTGQDNIGVRTGFQSVGDISNYTFKDVAIYGAAEADNTSDGIQATPGQYGYQNLGTNTLSMQWVNGFVAGVDRIYTNIDRGRTTRGNGACYFDGLGGSHNNIDFEFTWEQTYQIENGRFEVGNKFILVTNNGAFSHVSVTNTTVHEYKGINGVLIEVQGQSSLRVENSTFANVGGTKYSSPILISSSGTFGTLYVQGCSFTSDVVFTKPGTSQFGIQVKDNVKLRDKWQSIGMMPNMPAP